MLFTKPSMSIEYLNKCYNNGIEIANILGEDKTLEITENVEVTDTKWLDELNDIISKDVELSDRLATSIEKNKEVNSDLLPFDTDTICVILTIILIYEGFKAGFYGGFYGIFRDFNRRVLEFVTLILMTKSLWLGVISIYFIYSLDCIYFPSEHING